jgi:hypothetical protein
MLLTGFDVPEMAMINLVAGLVTAALAARAPS